ncbi:hypothetical protein [Nitrospira sp. Kam-Ns4a]
MYIKRGRRSSAIRDNWKFAAGLTLACVAVSVVAAVSMQGLEGVMKKAALAFKAMDNPSQLTAEEKLEVKKLVKDRQSAKEAYEKMSPEERERAKQQFNSLSEAEKQKYREIFGK